MMDAAQIEKLWRRECAMLEGFINDRDEEIARLRQRNEQLVEFLLSLCNSLREWKKEEFKEKDIELHISPELIMTRAEIKQSSFIGPSGAELAWNEMKNDDALAGPENKPTIQEGLQAIHDAGGYAWDTIDDPKSVFAGQEENCPSCGGTKETCGCDDQTRTFSPRKRGGQ